MDWSSVSEEHGIYVVDVGMTPVECDHLVTTAEQACKGEYAAYTYAKQTLGCREYPTLAKASFDPVHSMVCAIVDKLCPTTLPSSVHDDSNDAETDEEEENFSSVIVVAAGRDHIEDDDEDNDEDDDDNDDTATIKTHMISTCLPSVKKIDSATINTNLNAKPTAITSSKKAPDVIDRNNINTKNTTSHSPVLQLDDREPHIVKYDVTKKERQKLDMHTDKSEWTFLIALSNGCGVDYEGGGTYFECLDATVHIQRGHALVFPGKLRHCGKKITNGLRFLLVGFLVDKNKPEKKDKNTNNDKTSTTSNTNSSSKNKDGNAAAASSSSPPIGIMKDTSK